MRGLKSTIALIVVLIGLGAYIYFVTWKKTSSLPNDREKAFASLEADKIEELRIKSSTGDTTTLKKGSGGWQLVEPVATAADETEVSGLTSALSSLEIVRTVDENPADLKDYGLTEPRIRVEFKAAGDKDYRRLLIGDKTPTGSDLFAKRNDEKKVFMIPSFQESTLDHGTFQLRDKTLVKFDRDKVDGVDITTGGKTITIAKDGADWKLTSPVQVRADYGTVEGLIGKLQGAQMKAIASNEPTPAELKTFGFDKPAATINVNLGSARATVLIGGKADDTTLYARDTSKPAVVRIENTLADDLKKSADDYRRKDVFEFRPYNADRVELTRGGQTVTFAKVKGQGENAQDKWRRSAPAPAADMDVDKEKMDNLLNKLSNMRASSFVESTAKTGLDAPVLTAVVKFDEGKKDERVAFGKAGSDAYAARPGDPGAAKVDTTELDDAIKGLEELSK